MVFALIIGVFIYLEALHMPDNMRRLWKGATSIAQILILKIRNVFLRLKFSPCLSLNKIERFEIGSLNKRILQQDLRFIRRRGGSEDAPRLDMLTFIYTAIWAFTS
jgi:hypothetical protein